MAVCKRIKTIPFRIRELKCNISEYIANGTLNLKDHEKFVHRPQKDNNSISNDINTSDRKLKDTRQELLERSRNQDNHKVQFNVNYVVLNL